MSTNNFAYDNICVVVHNDTEYYCGDCDVYQTNESKCEKCGEEMQDDNVEDFYDADISNWGDILEERIKGFTKGGKLRDSNRNYPRAVLGSIDVYKASGDLYATIYAVYTSGYYSGACLDYVIEYDEYDEQLKSYDARVQKKCDYLAKILRTFGTEVRRVAVFSNGEAVYEKVK